MLTPMTRRTFFGTAAVLGQSARTGVVEPAGEREKLYEFNYSDVKLTGGPLKKQYDGTHAHFLALDNDRLLKVYRQRAGLPAPGEDMGGWYDAAGFVPGHTLGQFISGLSRYYSSTGSEATRAKVASLVEGFAATLGPGGYPYASEKAAITWPCYILDKYEIGMLDACRLARVEPALDLLTRMIRGAIPHIPDHTYDRGPNSPKQAPYDEPYILPENLFQAYELTGEKQFLDMAKLYLLNVEYFDPLAQGRNVLPGKHAYSHVIALSSAAKAYQALGDPKYLRAIRNAWDMIEQTQQYASGGWGPKEAFVVPHEGKLAESLTTTREHFETPCGCYAHVKLARYLLRFTGESRYGDGLERVLYNTILASHEPGGDGEYFYYSDYQALAKKGYYHRKWPCCSGTLIQTVADYAINIYFHGPRAIYVNLFTPSEVRWKTGGVPVKLAQNTEYPDSDSIEIRVEAPRPIEFALHLRIPAWLSSPPAFSLNGKSIDVAARRPAFASIRRKWKNNDTLQVRLPFGFRTEAIDDRNPAIAALLQGPRMMVATNPPADLSSKPLALPQNMRPVARRPSAFEFAAPDQPLIFQPFYSVRDEIYTSYFQIQARPAREQVKISNARHWDVPPGTDT
jgi:DUF1680 family protein